VLIFSIVFVIGGFWVAFYGMVFDLDDERAFYVVRREFRDWQRFQKGNRFIASKL